MRVRWRDDAGHTSEQELHLDRLPAPFATLSHPDVTEGRPMRVDALSHVGGRATELALSCPQNERVGPALEGPRAAFAVV